VSTLLLFPLFSCLSRLFLLSHHSKSELELTLFALLTYNSAPARRFTH